VTARSERGAATLLAVTAAAVLLFVGVALAGVAAIVLAQRTAQAAADLAALAAAASAVEGGDACVAAAEIAAANAAALVGCAVAGQDVRVAVRVPGPRLAGRRIEVTAEARAGPW
jgi:secretion/DNA translocation related TadE-like protein